MDTLALWAKYNEQWWIVFDMGLHGVRLVDPESPTGYIFVLHAEISGLGLS